MPMKRLLIIHHGQGVGGGLIALKGLIKDLSPRYQVTVFCIFSSEAVEELKRANVEVILPKSIFYKKYYDLLVHSEASFTSLLGEIRKFRNFILYLLNGFWFAPRALSALSVQYDIVYLNSIFITDWVRPAYRLNRKIVVHVREPLAKGLVGLRHQIIRWTIKKYANHVIAVSKDNARRLNLPDMTTQIYDPVYLSPVNQDLLDLDPDFCYFTYVGGSQRIKGFEQLVDCLPYLNENIRIFFLGYEHELQNLNDWRFFIRRALSSYARKLPKLRDALYKSPKILKIGISHDVSSYYKASVALISPFAKTHASLPIMESLSLGVPIIASDVLGTEELTDSSTGIIFPNGDAIMLALAINEMSTLPAAHLEKISVACREKFDSICNSNPLVVDVIESL